MENGKEKTKYKVITTATIEKLEKKLNELAKDDWEVDEFQMSHGVFFVIMRLFPSLDDFDAQELDNMI